MSSRTVPGSETQSSTTPRHPGGPADRFRHAWIEGHSPRIEEYLEDAGPDDREALLRELLELEVWFLAGLGELPDLEEYRARFADDAALVDAIWADAGIGSAVAPDSKTSDLSTEGRDEGGSDGPTVADVSETRRSPWTDFDLAELPGRMGRYQVEALLGEGGYGRVYRALDIDLKRRVAIKVPHPRRPHRRRDSEAMLAEARTVAGLDHPGIVPVYDSGRDDEGRVFIVSKYVEGGDLSRKLRRGLLTPAESAAILAAVAGAAGHAHAHKLVHRDIKPRNILLDLDGWPYLADFGAALREEDHGTGPTFAGTPYYMSPEQARGEGHLVDAGSDLFSLGVVFYEMLTGRRPFRGKHWRETLELIKTVEPTPPRHIVATIPRELERICLRLLAKRVADRHASADELVEDLRRFLEDPAGGASTPRAVAPLVPKGLRPFGADDADAYLRLLPGPVDRDGLPPTLAFWLGRIGSGPGEDPLRVGVVYGPSGSGKSSFVKAALLPRLSRRVIPLFLEATPEGTEARVVTALRRAFPDLPPGVDDASRLLAAIRGGAGPAEGHQLLLILDQFEQRLQATSAAGPDALAWALRQCDGLRVSALLIVRDDFWRSTTRFMEALEIPLIEGSNCRAVDLLDPKHARGVLEEFGRAFGALPAQPGPLPAPASDFLDGATADLAEGGRVVPVQLSLFAEMVKARPWTPETLDQVGGARGVGVAFLKECFGDSTAPLPLREHRQAARSVLEALLPGPGAELKGSSRPRSELLIASGLERRPGDFEGLIRALDHDLRLVNRLDPGDPSEPDAEPSYQLAHDYLVGSLRVWLDGEGRKSWRGRARRRLADRASLWNARRERKQLPSFGEWLGIRLLTRPSGWDVRETALMRAAGRHHAARVLAGVTLAAGVGWLGFEDYGASRSRSLMDRLDAAEAARVPRIVEEMAPFRRWVDPLLHEALRVSPPGSPGAIHARLALLPVDPAQAVPLTDDLLGSDSERVGVILRALDRLSPEVISRLWRTLRDPSSPRGRRLRAACALAGSDPENPAWGSVAGDLVAALTAEDILSLARWADLLRPVRAVLEGPLRATYGLMQSSPRGDVAATLLVDYAGDQPGDLAALILEAPPRELGVLASALRALGEARVGPVAVELGREASAETPVTDPASEDERDRRAARRANAAMALIALGRPALAWPCLRAGDDPRARTYAIARIGRTGVDPTEAIRRLRVESEPSVRQALLLALAGFRADMIPPEWRSAFLPDLLQIEREDPDPGVHSAVAWLLERWGLAEALRSASAEEPASDGPVDGRGWYRLKDGETMVVVRGPVEFRMGSPASEPDRKDDETPHARRVDRIYAIGAREVTVEQFRRLVPDHIPRKSYATSPDCPAGGISWFDAARYCRRLSEREGIEPDQMCYPPIEEIRPGMKMVDDFLKRTGYRLPTEAEWEAAARAGSRTARSYGHDYSPEILDLHAWSASNSKYETHPVGRLLPNAWGLFDALGNVYERCQDEMAPYPGPPGDGSAPDDAPAGAVVAGDSARVVRGGAFHRPASVQRSAVRQTTFALDGNEFVGLRVARTLPQTVTRPRHAPPE